MGHKTPVAVAFLQVVNTVRFKDPIRICNRQRGLSLVELMISLFLSSMVMIAVLSFFSNFKANSLLQERIVDNQHDLRIVSDLIKSEVQKAGFKNDVSNNLKDPFGKAHSLFLASRYVSGNSTTLNVRYQSNGSIRDCFGDLVPVDKVVSVSVTLNEQGNVVCKSGSKTLTVLKGVSALTFSYLEQNGNAYKNSAGANTVVGVKFNLKFVRGASKSQDQLTRAYTHVAALRNVF